jgi:hypothetical protein
MGREQKHFDASLRYRQKALGLNAGRTGAGARDMQD